MARDNETENLSVLGIVLASLPGEQDLKAARMSDVLPVPDRRSRTRWLRVSVSRFRRSDDGATAVEFGLLALPFFSLMYAILEVALVFWASQVLETATAAAARQIYTGQFQMSASNNMPSQTSADLQANFKTALCANVAALFDCPSSVFIDIRNITTNSAAATPPVMVNGAFNSSAFGYQTVAAGQTALVTAALEYKTIIKVVTGTPGLTSGNRILMATAIFQTEPYQ